MSSKKSSASTSVFTKNVHGMRTKYAAVSVLFLVLIMTLFELGGARVFGWYGAFALLSLILMVVTLFLLQCHVVLAPIEQLTEKVTKLKDKVEANETVRLALNGRDEFACLASSLDELLDKIQTRAAKLSEENARLQAIVSSAEVELVIFNQAAEVVNIVHIPSTQAPIEGLVRGHEIDGRFWPDAQLAAFRAAVKKTIRSQARESLTLTLGEDESSARRIRTFIMPFKGGPFVLVVFREDEEVPMGVSSPSNATEALLRFAKGYARDLTAAIQSGNESLREKVVDELQILAGEKSFAMKRVSGEKILDDAREKIYAEIGSRPIVLKIKAHPALPAVVADSKFVAYAINAFAHRTVAMLGPLPGKITLEAHPKTLTREAGQLFDPPLQPGRGVSYLFTDTTTPLSIEDRARAFHPYYSTHPSGRGMSLALAASILRAHGGAVRYVSESPRKGTQFEIFLYESTRKPGEAEQLAKEFPNGEVLVVDDNQCVLRITTMLLRTQKIAAHVASTVSDAVLKFSELSNRLRTVFLDAQLGEGTSVELLDEFHSIDPTVPVIIVSGYTQAQVAALFAKHKYDGFLSKPYTIAELQEVFNRVATSSPQT